MRWFCGVRRFAYGAERDVIEAALAKVRRKVRVVTTFDKRALKRALERALERALKRALTRALKRAPCHSKET
jgi:hypothetical protein